MIMRISFLSWSEHSNGSNLFVESSWLLDESKFEKCARKYGTPNTCLFESARKETISVTEEAVRVESEIDERVKGLYGL